jgi:hypothetical protein
MKEAAREAPNSKYQAPEKFQVPTSKNTNGHFLRMGAQKMRGFTFA